MSDFGEKFVVAQPSRGDRAQATRKQLLGRHGSAQADERTITIDSIGGREVWRRINGDAFELEVRP